MYSRDFKNLAIRLYNKLHSLRKVANILNINYSTVSRWVNNGKCIPRKKRNSKLENSFVLELIEDNIKSDPFFIIKNIKEELYKKYSISSSIELIRLYIKKIGYSRKRARYYSESKNSSAKLNKFLEDRKQFIKEKRTFVSIDETSFGRNFKPAVGYSKKGSRLNIRKITASILTTSALCAVCPNHPVYKTINKGSFNSDNFSEFIDGLDFPEKTVLLMDNVSFHHSYKVKEIANKHKWDILYIPPYSPVFNPIEGVFSIVKRSFVLNI